MSDQTSHNHQLIAFYELLINTIIMLDEEGCEVSFSSGNEGD
jgi:hypothetical protein